ncbi:MAG TPA: prolipoprotein diacylglyceryl transferase family protein, partial [Bdellovibrionales bacterium]|nr:prolipoprotein diacylglyceryl transferase family protein [Bdellovibrionales bacterium]
LTGLYLMLYAVGRSIVEEFRGDEIRGFVLDGQLSTSQAISAFMFAVGLGLCVLSRARASQSAARLPNP